MTAKDKGDYSHEAKAAHASDTKPYVRRWPWWHTAFSGRIYRPTMRFMHRLGWCFPEPTQMGAGNVWCHWCGMRGHRTAAEAIRRAVADMERNGSCPS
jgi:hypothetical protein